MYKEIIQLGNRLETSNKLPPPGFTAGQMIKWVMHLRIGDKKFFYLEEASINKSRPSCGRTSGTEAHPCVDEAGYVFRVAKQKGGSSDNGKIEKKNFDKLKLNFSAITSKLREKAFIDSGYVVNSSFKRLDDDFKQCFSGYTDSQFQDIKTILRNQNRTGDKHHKFLKLLRQAYRSNSVISSELKSALRLIHSKLCSKQFVEDERFGKILNKDWISFVIDDWSLGSMHLFEHPEIISFWQEELKRRTCQETEQKKIKTGICSICGKHEPLAKKIPLGIKLSYNQPTPLHSCNKDSFVSYLTGTQIFKTAHLGQCVICGDTIARTLNYLSSDNENNFRVIMHDMKGGKPVTDSPRNQFALFWLKKDQALKAGGETINPGELLRIATLPISGEQTKDGQPPADIKQLENMLEVPWTGVDAALRIADNEFYLLVLSPNKGRIAVREWFDVSLDKMQQNLKAFLDAQRIIDPRGQEMRCFGLPEILRAVDPSNISKDPRKITEIGNPNISRGLLRTAYLGEPPPVALLETGVMCMRNPKIFDKEQTLHVVMAAFQLVLTHKKEGTMEENQSGLCGRLLAILEEAQLRASHWKINTTLVERFYGSASSAPASVFGTLVSRATTDHFPKIRKNQLGYQDLEAQIESVQSAILAAGGYPKIFNLKQQAQFSLGFYKQRADFSAIREQRRQAKIQGGNP